ncbi:phytoene/squalene synthase family protein [Paenibacillus chungangensis]|uniref:Phytoene/squalene synthase family protein n=1 Tax=Paenibacillus chungangensis TaxID=696535 RepID=A0ABW3HLR1_9BACL
MAIAESLASCEEMIRQGSSTFHKAFGYLPSPRKEAVFVIYAFCRMIDDAVDEPERAPYSLDELKSRFDALDTASGHFIWPSLRWLFDTFPIGKQPFYLQMEGQRRDLTLTQYDTMEQLEEYCYLVAGTVGEMLLPVLHDSPDDAVVKSGIQLGKAMQIVNIVRDIGEDRERGRRYIPLQWLTEAGYELDSFRAGVINAPFKRLIDRLEDLSRQWFRQGLTDIASYPASSGFSVELAARYYEAILDAVKANGYDVYTRRAYVSPFTKVRIYQGIKKKYAKLSKRNKESAV